MEAPIAKFGHVDLKDPVVHVIFGSKGCRWLLEYVLASAVLCDYVASTISVG